MSDLQTSKRRSLVKILSARDGYRCHYCGVCLEESNPKDFNPNGASVDHIKPQIEGGTDELDNLVLACRKCNQRKKNRPYAEFAFASHTDAMIKYIMGLES